MRGSAVLHITSSIDYICLLRVTKARTGLNSRKTRARRARMPGLHVKFVYINSPRSCYTILIPNYDHILWTCKYWRGCDGRLTFARAHDATGSLSAGHRRPCQAPADVRHPSRTSLRATGGSTQPGAMPPNPPHLITTQDIVLGRRNASTLLTCGGWEGNTLEVQKHSPLLSLPCSF